MLDVTGLGHAFGANQVFTDISLTVNERELVCIVGPSGCGKSTLLRSISGLMTPKSGEILLHGQPVRGKVPGDLAVVFQDYSRSLYPWLTAAGNVEFPLKRLKLTTAERKERVREALEWVGLADAGKKRPRQMSGGMQQRVAIARALAYRPALMLMDEPFASVDAQTRFELEDLLLRVRREHDCTVLLVTHDIDESVYLGDRVVVLSRPPATVAADMKVELPAERDQIKTRASEAFVSLRSEVARLLHGSGTPDSNEDGDPGE